jgi:hypothetical protein
LCACWLPQDRDLALRQSGGLRCHFFNTFFLNKLYRDSGYKYSEVRWWLGGWLPLSD